MNATSLQAMKNEAGIRNIHLSLPGQQWGQLKMLVQYYRTLDDTLLVYFIVKLTTLLPEGLLGIIHEYKAA